MNETASSQNRPFRDWLNRHIKRINFALALLLGMYLMYAGYYFVTQRSILYPGTQLEVQSSGTMEVRDAVSFWIIAGTDSCEVVYLPPTSEVDSLPAPMMIFAHGNMSLIDNWITEFSAVRAMGIAVLLPEFPGFGRSSGNPTQKRITRAFVAAYDSVSARGWIDTSRVVFAGHSLGAGVAAQLALKRPGAALVLAAPFVNTRLLAARYLLPGFLVLDPWDNRSVVRRLKLPVLVMHGTEDKVVGYGHGVTLFKESLHGVLMSYEGDHDHPLGPWKQAWLHARPFFAVTGLIEPHPEDPVLPLELP
jgi:pimeloyl-ACP methyl ester carboxylesterase